jgi:NADPH:quinone reductase
LLTRILKLRDVHVIATVSSEAKAQTARDAGADELLILGDDDFSEQVRDLTSGRGVDVAYDGIGKDSFDRSLASVATCGKLVLYGAASGPVPPVDPQALARAGSVSLIRPRLMDYIATAGAFDARTSDLFGWIARGELAVQIGGRYPLEQAADAHRALESRATTGKLILTMGND